MKENKKLPLILVLALPILLIISTEVSDISFNVMGQPIYLINFIFPLTFLVSALISKKTESKYAITLVSVSLIIQCLVFVLKWIFSETVDYVLMEVTFWAFFMSHFLLLLGYEVLKESKKINKFEFIFILLLISTLIETMFYLIFYAKVKMISFIMTIVVKIIYDLIIAKILEK